MACCVLAAAAIGALLAIKARLWPHHRSIDALTWRMRRIDHDRSHDPEGEGVQRDILGRGSAAEFRYAASGIVFMLRTAQCLIHFGHGRGLLERLVVQVERCHCAAALAVNVRSGSPRP